MSMKSPLETWLVEQGSWYAPSSFALFLFDIIRKQNEALKFYADENNTVRACVLEPKLCANVDHCKPAQACLAEVDAMIGGK